MDGSTIDVVVPTYNGWGLVRRCLDRLREQSVEHRVIVVDDASSDGTRALLAEHYPEATVIAKQTNEGFSRAVNAGIESGSGEVVVVLNNDVECRSDFLERIVEPLAADASVGSVAALLLQADEASVDCLGVEVDSTLAFFPRLWGAPQANGAVRGMEGLLGPVGGAAAYRRKALDEIGGFDESIFGYGEDVDLALRMRAAGWDAAAAPEAVGVHLGSATFGRFSPKRVFHVGWSRAYLLRKYGVLRRPATMVRALGTELTSVAWQVVRTRDLSGLRGRVAGWRAGRRTMSVPAGAINSGIGFREAVRRRRSYRRG